MLLSLDTTIHISGGGKSKKTGSDQNCILEQPKIRSYPSLERERVIPRWRERESVLRRGAVFATEKNSSLTSGGNILNNQLLPKQSQAHLQLKISNSTDWKFLLLCLFTKVLVLEQ